MTTIAGQESPNKKEGRAGGKTGKILAGTIYVITALFVVAYFWQSIASLF
jgi:hypothetical protein